MSINCSCGHGAYARNEPEDEHPGKAGTHE